MCTAGRSSEIHHRNQLIDRQGLGESRTGTRQGEIHTVLVVLAVSLQSQSQSHPHPRLACVIKMRQNSLPGSANLFKGVNM